MDPLKISAVSYLNTFPFVYGLLESGLLKNFRLDLDIPSVCAEKMKRGEVDIALVPAGALSEIADYHLISDYCIGAVKNVKTVLLLSHHPLERLDKIYLDFDSRTSVELVKVLARYYWNIRPSFENLRPGEANTLNTTDALVAIGDKTFALRRYYPYVYDLAAEWIQFTGLPFVFAVWVSGKKIPLEITGPFNDSLAWGLDRKAESLEFFKDKLPACEDCLAYLEENISYKLDEKKQQGLELFLNYVKQMTIDK